MSCHINYVFNSSHANTMTKLDSLILQVLDYENSRNTLLYKLYKTFRALISMSLYIKKKYIKILHFCLKMIILVII